MICNSVVTKETKNNERNQIKEKNQVIHNNLLYWLRQEWYTINYKKESLEKSFVIEKYNNNANEKLFISKGQTNNIDCGLFVCLYIYETIQWLIDSKQFEQKENVLDYLSNVDQVKVDEFRCEFIELLTSLHLKQQTLKEKSKTDTKSETDDGSDVVMFDPCHENVTNNTIIDASTGKNEKHVLISKSNSNTNHRYKTRLKYNNIEIENNEATVDLFPFVESKKVNVIKATKENIIEETDNVVIGVNECKQSLIITNDTVNETYAVTVVSDSVLPYMNINSNSSNKIVINAASKQTEIESHMNGKEISVIAEEDELSNLSTSLDPSGSLVSCSTATSRKRKAPSDIKHSNKLNAIVESVKYINIDYVRAVVSIDMTEEDLKIFMEQSVVDYNYLKNNSIKHTFQWYIYCKPSKSKKNSVFMKTNNKYHSYSIISESVLILTTNESLILEWKDLCLNLFKQSRCKIMKNHISDDNCDVDYLNNYQNRGKLNAPNVFYFEFEDKVYDIESKYTDYKQYYYNDQVEKFYGIKINENGTTSNDECKFEWIANAYGLEFCEKIQTLWSDLCKNKKQYLYESWPGHIIPFPSDYTEICVSTYMPYFDDCLEVAPFVILSNALYLINNISLAKEVYESREQYYNKICAERNGTNIPAILSSVHSKKSDEHIINEKTGRPFHSLTKICTKGKIKSIALTNKFCLLNHHSIMNDDDIIVLCLRSNGLYLCVTKKFILSSNMKYPVAYSAKVLHQYSYGVFGGIKEGIYICNIHVRNDFIMNFKGKYNPAAYEVCDS